MRSKVHFIGIGGIGISAIARFLRKGHKISGSDIKESKTTLELQMRASRSSRRTAKRR